MKQFVIVWMALFLLLAQQEQALAQEPDGLSGKARSSLHRLALISQGTLQVAWDEHTQTPSLLSGRLTKPSNHSPEWIVHEFMTKHKSLYDLPNPRGNLRTLSTARHQDGTTQVHVQRLLYGTPVWGDRLTVTISEQGVIRSVQGRIHPRLEERTFHRPIRPAITVREAVAAATASAVRSGLPPTIEPSAEIYYLPERPGTPLVYAVTLQPAHSAGDPGPTSAPRTLMVHALLGHIVGEE